MSGTLQRLLAPVPIETFVREHWGRRPLHVKGAAGRFADIFDEPSAMALLASGAGPSREASQRGATGTRSRAPAMKFRCAFPHGAWIGDFMKGARPDLVVEPEQVPPLLAAGCTVEMTRVETADARVRALVSDVKAELSFPGQLQADCWLSTRDQGVEPHFDAKDTLVLQIAGEKRWRVSDEVALPWPLRTGHRLPDGGIGYPGGASSAWEHEVRPVAADTIRELLVEPGDLLFVPAGAYHATRAASPRSLALHLHFAPATFHDLLSPLLADALQHLPEWRHLPIALDGGASPPPHLVAFFRARLAELRARLDALPPDGPELAEAWHALVLSSPLESTRVVSAERVPVAADDRLALFRGAPARRALVTGDDGREEVHLYSGEQEVGFEEPALFAFARNLFEHRGGFRAGDATGWSDAPDGYRWEEVRALLEDLLKDGFLERV